MPQTTTKKKTAGPGLEKRVKALEAKVAELEAKVEKCHKKIDLVIKAVAEGRMDLL